MLEKSVIAESIAVTDLSYDYEAPATSGIKPQRSESQRWAGLESVKASIAAIGLIVPLVIQRHKGKAYVRAGNNRLRAVRELLGDDVTVPCVDVAHLKGTPAEVALADNVIRSPLHPVDKCEAFAALVDAGSTVDEIAARYSIPPLQVRQSLAIRALAPIVRDAWRTGEIKADAAVVFTLEPDQERQAALFAKLKKGGRLSEYSVREAVTGGRGDHNTARFLAFVGRDAYEAAGGKVQEDLFTEQHAVSNPVLLKKLADAKLKDMCDALVKDGWSFAVPADEVKDRWSHGSIRVEGKPTKEERARLAELRKIVERSDHPNASEEEDAAGDAARDESLRLTQLIQMRAYDEKQKARSGCFVSIDRDGGLEIEPGRTRPTASGRPGATTKTAQPKPKTPAEQKAAEKARQRAADRGDVSNALERDLAATLQRGTMLALQEQARKFEAMTHGLSALLCGLASERLDPDERYGRFDDKEEDAIRQRLDPVMLCSCICKAFDAADYFGRVPKARIIAVLREACGAGVADAAAKLKTGEAAKVAHDDVPRKGWLPPQLRGPWYAGPGAAKAKPEKRRRK